MKLTKTQKLAVEKLIAAIDSTTEGLFGKPVLKSGDGWNTPTICWDGPFEWTMITAGSSVYCGELGNYSSPTEPKIADALKRVARSGLFLEPISSGQIGCYTA